MKDSYEEQIHALRGQNADLAEENQRLLAAACKDEDIIKRLQDDLIQSPAEIQCHRLLNAAIELLETMPQTEAVRYWLADAKALLKENQDGS